MEQFAFRRLSKYLLACTFFLPMAGCGQNWNTKEKNNREWSQLDGYIEAYHRANGFSGSILIAKGNNVVLQKTSGWQNIKNSVPISEETRFNMGSGNKMFTAVAIAQLAERGKIDYFAPIINYLPNYPDQDFAAKATIDHLLTHSSGLGDFRDSAYKADWANLETLSETLPYVTSKPLLFEPGKGHSYSNSGFLLLGLIIESVTGENYFEYIRQNIYSPADMKSSDSYRRDGSVKNLAIPYQGYQNEWYEAQYGLMGTSAGGGFSTSLDVLNFSRALYDHKLISSRSLSLVTTDKATVNSENSWQYGYGFIVKETNGIRQIGHGGNAAGVFFEYYHYPSTDCTLIMFSNSEAGSPDVLFNKINEYLTDPKTELNYEIPASGQESKFEVRLVEKPENEEFVVDVLADKSTDSDFTKYSQTSIGIINSIKTKDIDSFNGFFANLDIVTKASNESMFNFMIEEALPIKGRIAGLHILSEPVSLKQSEYPIRVLVFHLEDGSPGSISFSLNQDGKVDYLSLFVHDQICPNRKSKTCDLIERKIE